MTVRDPQGRTWRVTRRWVPWRRRIKDLDTGPDMPSGLGDDPISMIVGLLFLVLLLPFLLLAFLALIELLLLLLVLPFAVLGRVLLGHHWVVEARRGWTPVWEEEVGDWKASAGRIADIADRIQRGDLPPTTLTVDG
jgi:hypothetical protein